MAGRSDSEELQEDTGLEVVTCSFSSANNSSRNESKANSEDRDDACEVFDTSKVLNDDDQSTVEENPTNSNNEVLDNTVIEKSMNMRSFSFSLNDLANQDPKPFSARQRSHPRRKRSERRDTRLSGLNLLLPRNFNDHDDEKGSGNLENSHNEKENKNLENSHNEKENENLEKDYNEKGSENREKNHDEIRDENPENKDDVRMVRSLENDHDKERDENVVKDHGEKGEENVKNKHNEKGVKSIESDQYEKEDENVENKHNEKRVKSIESDQYEKEDENVENKHNEKGIKSIESDQYKKEDENVENKHNDKGVKSMQSDQYEKEDENVENDRDEKRVENVSSDHDINDVIPVSRNTAETGSNPVGFIQMPESSSSDDEPPPLPTSPPPVFDNTGHGACSRLELIESSSYGAESGNVFSDSRSSLGPRVNINYESAIVDVTSNTSLNLDAFLDDSENITPVKEKLRDKTSSVASSSDSGTEHERSDQTFSLSPPTSLSDNVMINNSTEEYSLRLNDSDLVPKLSSLSPTKDVNGFHPDVSFNFRHQCFSITNRKTNFQSLPDLHDTRIYTTDQTREHKLSFHSSTRLSKLDMGAEFTNLIEITKQLKKTKEYGSAVDHVELMSPTEREKFEEFCDTVYIGPDFELKHPASKIKENNDPTEKLIEHLLSRSSSKRTDESRREEESLRQLESSKNASEDQSQILFDDNLAVREACIIPSVLLSQTLSMQRPNSSNSNELDFGGNQNSGPIIASHEDTLKEAKIHPMFHDVIDQNTMESTSKAPPLPPKSTHMHKKRQSLQLDCLKIQERRGGSLNLEDACIVLEDAPPLPPRRGGSLIVKGNYNTAERTLPIKQLASSSAKVENSCNLKTHTLPPPRVQKRCRSMRDRNCVSSAIPDDVEVHSPTDKTNFSDPNLSFRIHQNAPPNLPPKPSVSRQNSSSDDSHPCPMGPPPRPPSFFRSMSSREGALEKSAVFVLASQAMSSDPTSMRYAYGRQLLSGDFHEAINSSVKHLHVLRSALPDLPPIDTYTEPTFQHFPVKIDGTHQRLSIVSNTSSEVHQSYDNEAFKYSSSELAGSFQWGRGSYRSKDCQLSRNKSSSSSDADASPRIGSFSSSSSTRASDRSRDKVVLRKLDEGVSTSNLLSNEAPVPCDSLADLPASLDDCNAGDKFVTDKSQIKFSSSTDSGMPSSPRMSRARRYASRLSSVSSVVGWNSRDKSESKKHSQDKESWLVDKVLRLSFLRDTSVRGLPSDLSTLADSVLVSEDKIRLSSTSQPHTSNDGMKPRAMSSLDKDFIWENDDEPSGYINPLLACHAMDSSGDALDSGDSHDGRRETNNNCKQKNSVRILQSLQNLKRDMRDYTAVLESLQENYEEMRSRTPDGIRQRFDLAIKEVKIMHELQLKLNEKILDLSGDDLSAVADAFKTEDFSTYKRYSILARDLQKEIKSHSSYFSENFQQFSSNIMRPFHRLNSYSQYLQSFLNNFVDETESKLQDAVSYLNNLKNEANTEMNICDLQKCPVELRLAGLISYAGALHYDGDLFPKHVYVILFDSIMVISEDNHEYRVYKQHYRSEQVTEVNDIGGLEIEVKVHPTFQSDTTVLKFKANLTSDKNNWITHFHSWQQRNLPSYKAIILNSDLQKIIRRNTKHNRFLPLSLWNLSPALKAAVDIVKQNKVTDKNIKLNKIHNSSRPSSVGDDEIFSSFMFQVDSFVSRLDVLLDHEALAPPPLLGSVLRKLRRFYKSVFIPQLRADYEKRPEKILVSIMGNLPNIPPLFIEFIEVRSSLTLVMETDEGLTQYVSPFHHLSYFIEWLFSLSCIARYHDKLRGHLGILMNCVEDSRVTILHSAITNCHLDFYKTGDIVRTGTLESKVRCRSLRSNQDYYVILFEKAILFTRPKIPQYEYVQVLWLDQMTFGPQPVHRASFRLEERSPKKPYVYELRCTSELSKSEWQRDILAMLHKQAELIKKNLN
ncbi:uncharacterized protein LOC108679759 [Hyalella azteca]|uniref:Uncharacterized protein LOC108679759 n=1 Tax=Hyalella azteca TaxID=294128 RepID=A0A8B7PCV3_HYAAZ|nr:uncharacterized protein LOC108679759 [Hyalella azteca]